MERPRKEDIKDMFSSRDETIENQSIIRRLTASLIFTVLIVSIIAVTAMHYIVYKAAMSELDQKADDILSYLVGTLEMPLWAMNDDGVKTIGRTVSYDESIVKLIIRNEFGVVIYSMEKEKSGDLITRSGKISHNQWGVENLAGDVSVSLTPAVYKESNRRLLLFSILIIFLILISVLIVTVIFIRTCLNKPLNGLNEITARFASGIYDASGIPLPYLEFQPFRKALVQLADKIEQQIRMVKAAEGKYRSIFENSMEGIFQSTTEGRYLSVNPAFARMYGYDSPEELIAGITDIGHQHYVRSEDREKFRSVIEEHGFVERFEVEGYRRDGSRIWVSINARAVRDQYGGILYYEGSVEDITERKRMEEELLKSRDELEYRVKDRTAALERSNQALQDFAFIASHDLREPLRKVISFGNMLLQKYEDSLGQSGKDYLARMLDATGRMQSLLTGLLEYSRVTTNPQPFKEVDLYDIIQEVLSDLEVSINKTGGEVQVGELPAIEADPTQMRQLFQNLIGNALKFHKDGQRPLVKVLCSAADKREYRISVEDNGIGFDEKYLEKIFAPFQRLHGRSSQYEGTGIGLAICKKIVERHGGNLTAKSAPGEGSQFIITLPIKQKFAMPPDTMREDPLNLAFIAHHHHAATQNQDIRQCHGRPGSGQDNLSPAS